MLLTHPSLHRTVRQQRIVCSPKASGTEAEEPCTCVEYALLYFSALAAPQEGDVASARDAEVPGPGFWKEMVFEFHCTAMGERHLSPTQ